MENPFLATAAEAGNVVLDLDGVVFLGGGAIPGAGEALTSLERRGWHLVFATNNATRTRAEIADRIRAMAGFSPSPDRIVTSALAAAAMLSGDDDPCFVVGEQGLVDTLTEAGRAVTSDPSQAETVIVALDRGFTYDKMSAASQAIRRGARFVATNTDATYPTPGGQVPGAGSIVAAVRTAAGREPELAGKPMNPMIDAIRATLASGEVWVVGDRPETDLALAKAAGWRSVLTLTGVTTDASTVPAALQPDLVVESLPALLSQ